MDSAKTVQKRHSNTRRSTEINKSKNLWYAECTQKYAENSRTYRIFRRTGQILQFLEYRKLEGEFNRLLARNKGWLKEVLFLTNNPYSPNFGKFIIGPEAWF